MNCHTAIHSHSVSRGNQCARAWLPRARNCCHARGLHAHGCRARNCCRARAYRCRPVPVAVVVGDVHRQRPRQRADDQSYPWVHLRSSLAPSPPLRGRCACRAGAAPCCPASQHAGGAAWACVCCALHLVVGFGQRLQQLLLRREPLRRRRRRIDDRVEHLKHLRRPTNRAKGTDDRVEGTWLLRVPIIVR